MLRQHDSRFRDQPSDDRQDRVCPACEQLDSIESIQHVILHCPVHERRRAALRMALAALPAAQAFPAALTHDEGVVAFLRDDFMGGAQAALVAADTFLHAVNTFRNICSEHDQRFTVPYICTYLPCMHGVFVHECLACLDCLHVAAPNEEVLSPRNP